MKSQILLVALFVTASASAQQDIREKNFNVKRGVAMEGYDPVSYFDGRPQEGKSAMRFTQEGVTYQFATQANLARFRSSPEKYEPAYGGWCAYAMGRAGEKVKIDPETYKVINDKLYLFYNFWGNNTLTDWNRDEPLLKNNGDQNWKRFVP
ncbi:MAG: YHS domain-containing (seleno)protein [Cytophagales bacterium]|nr:YHS domain-containing (seleno)protein [Cytophagales bacterium]